MAIVLSDDGTMDTVLRCEECGEEFRFTYDPSSNEEQANEMFSALREANPDWTDAQINSAIDDRLYDEWIDWCIEEAEADHECPAYHVETWFERDRAHVALYYGTGGDANDDLIVEWWDDAVREAVEDGFLDPKDWEGSALAYARSVGLAKK